jgi:hypothetical protein
MTATTSKFGLLVGAVVSCAVVLAVALSGCTTTSGATSGASAASSAAAQAPTPSAADAAPDSAERQRSERPSPPPAAAEPLLVGASADIRSLQSAAAAPVRIRIDTLGIDMGIEAVGLSDQGAMALPSNPAVAAWYRYGSAPDSAAGGTIIAAHVDSLVYDIGPFARLASAPVGTEIVVSLADGRERRYSVASVQSILKPDVPWGAVFDRTGPPRLTLVTCGGEFDYTALRYLSNVIVSANPVP